MGDTRVPTDSTQRRVALMALCSSISTKVRSLNCTAAPRNLRGQGTQVKMLYKSIK